MRLGLGGAPAPGYSNGSQGVALDYGWKERNPNGPPGSWIMDSGRYLVQFDGQPGEEQPRAGQCLIRKENLEEVEGLGRVFFPDQIEARYNPSFSL